MDYTVKKVSQLSGVSVRTLHFYEEIALLKPAYHGSNGYRYYTEKELLQLQQILFFKELGFSLKEIQNVMRKSGFQKLEALHSHKQVIGREITRLKKLLSTIDKTICHLEGKKKMENKDFFEGFVTTVKFTGLSDEETVLKSIKHPERLLSKASMDKIDSEMADFYSEVGKHIKNGLEPCNEKVQQLISKHYAYTEQFHNLTSEVYTALANLYKEHPAFRKQLDRFDSELAEFMSSAMKSYVQKQMS